MFYGHIKAHQGDEYRYYQHINLQKKTRIIKFKISYNKFLITSLHTC